MTADDDILYKETWLEEMVYAHKKTNGITTQRAHIVQYNDVGEISPYSVWMKKTPKEKICELNSPNVFPTSGGGVLYPPNCFNDSILDIDLAMRLCPIADDIWYYFMHNINNHHASLIGERFIISATSQKKKRFIFKRKSRECLWYINKHKNDEQIQTMIKEFGLPNLLNPVRHKTQNNHTHYKSVDLISGYQLYVLENETGKVIQETKNYYDFELINYLKKTFFPKTVVDIGINIGNYSVGLSGKRDYKVVCFESNFELAQIAKRNLKLNNINHTVYNFACGTKNENISFSPADHKDLELFRSSDELNIASDDNHHSLDECIDLDTHPELIMIHADRSAHDVLVGARELIKRLHPVIVLKQKNVNSYKECKEFLTRFKYIPLSIKGSIPSLIFIHQETLSENDISEKSRFVESFFRMNELFSRQNFDDI